MTSHAGRVVARLLLGAAMLGTMTGQALAQMGGAGGAAPPPRSPAVFGGAQRPVPGENNVFVSVSGFGGYDTNILAGDGGVGGGGGVGVGLVSTEQTDSTFVGTSANLTWQQQRRRVSYFGNVGGQYRTFFDIDDFDLQAYDALGGFTAQVSPRGTFSAAANVGVQPFYQFGVLGGLGIQSGGIQTPGTGAAFTPDFQGAREQVLRYGAQAGYAYRLGERTTFSADISRQGFRPLNTAADQAGLLSLGSTFAGARIQRRLTTNLGARVGYGYGYFDRVSQRSDGESARVGFHNLDVGLDYARALTIARRTTFSFGTGTNIVRGAGVGGVGQPLGESRTLVTVSGFAALQREFLRTWGASLNYTRGTSYFEGVNRFGIFDTASASVSGLFTDRLDAGASVSYTTGGLQFGTNERIANTSAGAQLRYALSSNVAAFAAYTYSHFDLPLQFQPIGLDTAFRRDRQGVRVGVSVFVDLLR